MSSFSDEPVLVKPTARGSWKRWLAIVVALGLAATVVYIPFGKSRLDEHAHEARRGPRQGAVYPVTLEGSTHALELTWAAGGHFAPTLDPAPAAGTTLQLACRFGKETLAWNAREGCFGPSTFGGGVIDPYSHYKLSLRLEREGRVLWKDSLWAYGIHETHGHAH